jgi:homoserine kinase type II
MAVFTEVSAAQLEHWLGRYALGPVGEFRGIPSGIENSNFFVSTSDAAWVLTLFERLSAQQLPYYLELMRHLAARGVPCPAPLADREGQLFSMLNGKPAALVTRLPGRSVTEPQPDHCALIGTALARMHLAGQDFALQQPNLRGLAWWQQTVPGLLQFLAAEPAAMLHDEMAQQSALLPAVQASIPSGPVHADLFRDNALFESGPRGDTLGGFIDFYFAGNDSWLFDVAVCLNDWCIDHADGQLRAAQTCALLEAYAAVRPFTTAELQGWPLVLRAAALRFWVSRLYDFHQPRRAAMLTPHDPTHFERILRLRRAAFPALPHSFLPES